MSYMPTNIGQPFTRDLGITDSEDRPISIRVTVDYSDIHWRFNVTTLHGEKIVRETRHWCAHGENLGGKIRAAVDAREAGIYRNIKRNVAHG